MSLLQRLRRWLRPNRDQPVVVHSTAAEPVPHAQPKPQPAAPVAPEQTGIAEARASISVYYQDRFTESNLLPPQLFTAEVGAPFELTWHQLPGRLLSEVVGFTDHFINGKQKVILYYEESLAAPVIVYHRDTNHRLIAPPEYLLGNINAAFTAEALPDQRQHVQDKPEQRGIFTDTSQTITFTYELNQLESNPAPTSTYVHLDKAKAVFEQPQAEQPLATLLPAGSVWQVFILARETTNGTMWLNVGGNSWLTASDTTLQDHNPYILPTPSLDQPQLHFESQSSPFAHAAVIDGPSAGTMQWDAPYGQRLTRLANGTKVALLEERAFATSLWYQLQSGNWVQAEYLKIKY
ncbi:MucBP domain-containing protein [Lacticaseibacillus brantae]|uniref:MucBP domain-containing protein n=1 Tax=Lacticaseibacillus brantae DSM 23927 TaxID=1423727 RepID=A0A0R2B087_9LACO|nr:MucBP domain-containing protein [Lacticaseibacillus brantae]KRM72453.1 hypothetical protein FC34_GL000158 [Lacticaseibacillus brantae DSM 23927]